MKKLILIIGAPGSGKTTDAELIAEKNSELIKHYSTGDMFRAEVASGSERGKTIESYISKGNLVPIEIVIETIVGAIKNAPTPNV
ncbi:MAG: nucleoside monophosphate kinase, partial [Campylobacterota bacterium]|nr:nucleoside monophosphate kinase [Campylobacterota bacterium]